MKQPGKRAQLFVGKESSYGTPPSLTAGHAMRHVSASMDFDPFNRVFSGEKKSGPGRYALFDRRGTAAGSLEGLLRPSGTLNTLPECAAVLEALFGSVSNVTLATAVDVTSDVDGAVLDSVAGLVAGTSALLITCPDGKKRVRLVQTVDTEAKSVTWAPSLPSGQAPADDAVVKSCIVYKLTNALSISLFIARYTYQANFTAGLGEILKGWVLDRGSLLFDYQEEPRFTVSGPAQLKADAPAHPGSFTQVGTNPPTAITAEALIGSNTINFMKIGIEITNGLEARNDEINHAYPSEAYRMGDRDISIALDMAAENSFKAAIYDLAMAGTFTTVFKQTGFTEGKIVALYAPRCEFKPPTTDVPDGAVNWPFKGRLTEGIEDANDELRLVLA